MKRSRLNRLRGGSRETSSRYIVRKPLKILKTLRIKKANQLRKDRNLATDSRGLKKLSKKTNRRQREKLAEASHVPGKLRRQWSTSAKMRLPKKKKRQRKRVLRNPLIREKLKERARRDVMITIKMTKSLPSSLQLSKSIVLGTGDARRRKRSSSRLRL